VQGGSIPDCPQSESPLPRSHLKVLCWALTNATSIPSIGSIRNGHRLVVSYDSYICTRGEAAKLLRAGQEHAQNGGTRCIALQPNLLQVTLHFVAVNEAMLLGKQAVLPGHTSPFLDHKHKS
jgi:hypothetical protein